MGGLCFGSAVPVVFGGGSYIVPTYIQCSCTQLTVLLEVILVNSEIEEHKNRDVVTINIPEA